MASESVQIDSQRVVIRPLAERDLDAADRIFRLAFGTFVGLADPMTFAGDADYVRSRFHTDPTAAFGAYADGELVGSNFACNWGSVGFFGPLTIRPDLWQRGIGKRLIEPVVECFDRWGATHAGLFTFPHSAKHLALYQRFGFWPRFLTPLMSKAPAEAASVSRSWATVTASGESGREERIAECAEVTSAIYPGLDVAAEIRSVASQRLGDTVLVRRDQRLAAFAVCQCGAGTEGGTGRCYTKFAAARPGPAAAEDFDRLIDAVEQFAAERGASRVLAGVNTSRHEAYTRLLQRGYRTDFLGVVMQRPNEAGYNRPGVYVVDDWR